MTISYFLTQDHRSCDDTLASTEKHVAKKDWEAAQIAFIEFKNALLHHFLMEEEVMFPAFETKSGMAGGPTQVMRIEHQQMRTLLSQLEVTINEKDTNDFFGVSETLMMLVQQHNSKEEQMLYRMADQHLANEAQTLIDAMQKI